MVGRSCVVGRVRVMCMSLAIGQESASDDHTLLMAELITHDICTVVQQESNTLPSYTTETFIRWESTVEFDTCHTHTRSTKCVLAHAKRVPAAGCPRQKRQACPACKNKGAAGQSCSSTFCSSRERNWISSHVSWWQSSSDGCQLGSAASCWSAGIRSACEAWIT